MTKVTFGLGNLSVREAVAQVLGSQMGMELPTLNPMSFARTVPEVPVRGRTRGWEFLPPVPEENLAFAYAMFQASLLLRDAINLHYAAASMIDLGEPAVLAAEMWKDEQSLRGLRDVIDSSVSLPTCKGVLPEAAGDRERMLGRVALADLSAGYPYQAGHRFAGRILTDQWIAQQYLAVLRQAIASPHPFLRRNAVYVLASLAYARNPEAAAILHEVVDRRNDAVAWFRAVRILSDAQDPAIPGKISALLPGRDPVTASFVMRELGMLKHVASSGALLRTSQAFDADPDVQWAFLEAICRLPGLDEGLHRRAQDLAERHKRGKGKLRLLRDLATLAVDRATKGSHVADQASKSLDRSAAREGTEPLLGEFHPSIRGIVVDHLGRTGWPRLKEIVHDLKETTPVRRLAMAAGPWKTTDGPWLATVARDRREPFELRAAAALRLFDLDRAKGGPLCGMLVDAYAEGYAGKVTQDLERAVHDLLERAGPGLVPGLLARVHRAGLEARVNNGMKKQGEFVETVTALLVARGESLALSPVQGMLSSAESVYRMNGAFGLSHFTSPAGMRRTVDLLSHEDPFVRQAAAFGLEKSAKVPVEIDWVYGSPKSRDAAAHQIRTRLGLD